MLAHRDATEWQQGLEEVEGPDQLAPYLGGLMRHHQKAPELMRLWIELAAAAARPDHPVHTYFAERYEGGRTQFAEDLHHEAARSSTGDRRVAHPFVTCFIPISYKL
ncbi:MULTISPECIES: hypothetical protein [unclassified Streptomyces]|uniref:hypothetical protein n=1 Tax=unclassified Streptomyces TaxID=2593676 RepID=UPI00382EA585